MNGYGRRTARVFVGLVGLVCAVGVAAGARTPQGPPTEGDVLRAYQARIDAYMVLHNLLEKESRPRGPADSPEQLHASQKALAAKILSARRNPRQGDIFTPDVRTLFRSRLRRVLQGPNAAELKKKNMRGPTHMLMRVHAEYPVGWPLASVPPSVLAVLPRLPEDLVSVRRDHDDSAGRPRESDRRLLHEGDSMISDMRTSVPART